MSLLKANESLEALSYLLGNTDIPLNRETLYGLVSAVSLALEQVQGYPEAMAWPPRIEDAISA